MQRREFEEMCEGIGGSYDTRGREPTTSVCVVGNITIEYRDIYESPEIDEKVNIRGKDGRVNVDIFNPRRFSDERPYIEGMNKGTHSHSELVDLLERESPIMSQPVRR